MIAYSPAKISRDTKRMILALGGGLPGSILLLCGYGYNRGDGEKAPKG